MSYQTIMCRYKDTEEDNELSFVLTSCQHMLLCYVCILCLRHNTPYTRWHVFWVPPFCKQGLRATLFSRNQTKSSRMSFPTFLPVHPRGVIWKIKSKSNFPVSFSLISAEMNLVGNYQTLRGLRTVNPEGLQSTSFPTNPVAILLPPGPTPPPFGSNLSFPPPPPPPPPLLPYAPNSLLSPYPLLPARAFCTLPVALPVKHTFHFGSPSTAYTGPIIHCLPPCPFRPSSVLQTSVGPGLLIPTTFYTPLPSNYPPTPLYLTHKAPPTLTHWWFSTLVVVVVANPALGTSTCHGARDWFSEPCVKINGSASCGKGGAHMPYRSSPMGLLPDK